MMCAKLHNEIKKNEINLKNRRFESFSVLKTLKT